MLPRRVQVRVKNTTEGGFVAELPEYGIFTQASTVPELVYMVNDAIFTYFDVSVEDRKHLPYFVTPPQSHPKKQLDLLEFSRPEAHNHRLCVN